MSHDTINNVPFMARGDVPGLSALVHRRMGAALRFWHKRRTMRALDRLSDWVLDDIGVTRAEIPRIAAALVADDPRPAALAQSALTARHDARRAR